MMHFNLKAVTTAGIALLSVGLLAGCSSLTKGNVHPTKAPTTAKMSFPTKVTSSADGKVEINGKVTTANKEVTLTDGKQSINIPAKSIKPVVWETNSKPAADTKYKLKLVAKGSSFKDKALATKTVMVSPSATFKKNYQKSQTATFHRYLKAFYGDKATLSYPSAKTATVKLVDKDMKGAIANIQQGYANREAYDSFKSQQLELSKKIKKEIGSGYTITLMNPNNAGTVLYRVQDGVAKLSAL